MGCDGTNSGLKKAFCIGSLALSLGISACAGDARAADEPPPWKVVKADHFIVHYREDEAFAREVARKADADYTRIASDLGYRRHGNFWMWDNRVKIFIYPTHDELLDVPGTREWSQAVSIYASKEIHCVRTQPDLIGGVLPHEITHLIFRDFVGTSSKIPLWMDEGVAQWEQPARRELAARYVRDLLASGDELPLKTIFSSDLGSLGSGKRVEKFYVQSVSVVDFLIRRHGGSRFTDFCRLLRDGKTLEDALRKTYPSTATFELLESEWRIAAQSV